MNMEQLSKYFNMGND